VTVVTVVTVAIVAIVAIVVMAVIEIAGLTAAMMMIVSCWDVAPALALWLRPARNFVMTLLRMDGAVGFF